MELILEIAAHHKEVIIHIVYQGVDASHPCAHITGPDINSVIDKTLQALNELHKQRHSHVQKNKSDNP